MKPLRIGIMGTGNAADNHALAFKEKDVPADVAVLWSVCGRDPAKASTVASVYGACAPMNWYANQDLFLADQLLDAVIIATPDALHAGHAMAVLRAGKHVLVEKPMTTQPADAYEMALFAFERNLRLGVGYHLRHHAGHRLLRKVLREGEIGDLVHIHIEWSTQSMSLDNWRATGEHGRWFALAALGTHAIDLASWLAESPILSQGIRGLLGPPRSPLCTRDQRVTLTFPFKSGATANLYVSVADQPVKYMRLVGTQGVIECRNTLGSFGGGEIILPEGPLLGFHPVNPYAAQIVNFTTAVREGRDPEVNGTVGHAHVCWLDDAERSMKGE